MTNFLCLQESTILKYLSLRGNHFSVVAGTHLDTALTENDTLAALDLSWNQLRLQGAVLLCHGLSVRIKRLYLLHYS